MGQPERKPGADEEQVLFPVALQLDHGAKTLLDELTTHTGLDASELVGWALGAYWRELRGIVLPPPEPMTHEDMDQVIRESEADFAAGRFSTNDEVFGRVAAKHGW